LGFRVVGGGRKSVAVWGDRLPDLRVAEKMLQSSVFRGGKRWQKKC